MADIVTVTTTLVPDEVTLTVSPLIDEITVNVTTVTDSVAIQVSNEVGPQGPAGPTGPAGSTGPQGPAGVSGIIQTWIGLTTGAATITGEIAVTFPAVGTRLTYTFAGAVIRYRFIATDGTADAFYSDAALTTLIVSRYF